MSSLGLRYIIYKKHSKFKSKMSEQPLLPFSQQPVRWELMGLGQYDIPNSSPVDNNPALWRKAAKCRADKTTTFLIIGQKVLSLLFLFIFSEVYLLRITIWAQLSGFSYWAMFLFFKDDPSGVKGTFPSLTNTENLHKQYNDGPRFHAWVLLVTKISSYIKYSIL